MGRSFFQLRCLAARSGDGWRGALARHVEGAHRAACELSSALAAASAPRRLLEARFHLRKLECHSLPGPCCGWLARRLYANSVPTCRKPEVAMQGTDRPVGAQGATTGGSRTGDRLPAGMPALVGSV